MLGSLINAGEVRNYAEPAQHVATATFAVVTSLSRKNISKETVGALLGLLESVENLPALG